MLFSLFLAIFGRVAFWPFWPNWPYRLESGVEVVGVSVGLGQLYARLLGHVEEALVGDAAPCGLQVVTVFLKPSVIVRKSKLYGSCNINL